MRKLALPILALGLAVPLCGTVWAAGGPGDAAPPPAADKPAAASSANLPDAPKPAAAKPAAAAPAAPAATATPAVESQLAELRALLDAQAAEIEAQRRELAEMKAKLGVVKTEAVDASVAAAVPAATAAVSSALPKNVVTSGDGKEESPVALHFKGITLTPGGFAVAETVYRNHALSADINTPLNNITNLYAGSNLSKISEFNASGRQSRIAMKFDGNLGSVKIGGYYEGDFLGAGTTSNNNESNSYLFRQRQFWGQVRLDSGWIFTGGQMWSLVTETKKLLENRSEATPLTIDAQYTVGFSWARQYGFRVVKNLADNHFALGFSVEGAQTRFTAHNSFNNYILQDPGNSGGLLNVIGSVNSAGAAGAQNYTLNATPDFVFKAAWEPGWGHYELFGLLRTFRSRIFPCLPAVVPAGMPCSVDATITVSATTTQHATEDTRAGGGIGGNLRVPLFNKKLDVGIHGLYGDGVGRYGTGSLADATVRPNGTLAPIRGGQGLATIEWHATPKLDIYLNGGGEYVARTIFNISPTVNVGYGSPLVNNSGCTSSLEAAPTSNLPTSAGSCTGDPRGLFEGTFGFWHKIWKGEHGTIQWGLQYSYVEVVAWSGTTGTPTATSAQFKPSANTNMFFTSFRYYLP